jgi:hypothetical protein
LHPAPDREWTDALRRGDFQRAWEISDVSLREYCASGAVKHTGPRHYQRIWRGEDLHDKRVLIRCYHGLGDTIQFIRFAKRLRQIARQIIVWGQPELLAMLRRVEGVDQALPLHDGTPDVAYDVDIEVMELAHALRATSADISSCVPYLACTPAAPVRRASQLGSIGLVWDVGDWDKRRCIPPQMLSALARTGVRLFSLQQGPARQMASAIPAEDIAAPDIETLAATILRLDLVVTVDTMVAHLAGALGAPVCTLLHADCDWRWPLRDRQTPWYPTMKLFHQQKGGDWTSVIEEVAEAIAAGGRQLHPTEARIN